MNIDLQALEETKKACHQELNLIQEKYNTKHSQLLYQFAIKEFKNQFIFSLVGMIGVCFVSYLISDVSLMCIIVYFLVLGCMALMEHIRNDFYEMKELISVSYIHEGRSFLYRSAIMGVFQLLMFIFLCCVLPLDTLAMVKAILYALLPVYLSQMIFIFFMKYIANIFIALVSYLSFYLVMIVGLEYFQVANYIELSTCILWSVIVLIIYMMNTVLFYKTRKEKDIIWN